MLDVASVPMLITDLQCWFVDRSLQVCCEIHFYLLSRFSWLHRHQNQQMKHGSDGVGNVPTDPPQQRMFRVVIPPSPFPSSPLRAGTASHKPGVPAIKL